MNGEVGRLFQHFSFPVSRSAAGEGGHAAIEARSEGGVESSYRLGLEQIWVTADRARGKVCGRAQHVIAPDLSAILALRTSLPRLYLQQPRRLVRVSSACDPKDLNARTIVSHPPLRQILPTYMSSGAIPPFEEYVI